jgi:D-erythronate 2-dehydrogenase
MKIIITGGSGFLGVRLARELLRMGALSVNGQAAQTIQRIVLTDRAAPPADLAQDARVAFATGDLNALLIPGTTNLIAAHADFPLVFHLAAAVSAECEADFDLGMRSNFAATHALLEACRTLKTQPMVVFASSLAVFGQTPLLPLPQAVTDMTLPTPQSSYGIQKYIGEQMMADYGRKGFVRARNVRLMTVSVRPGRPNGAASGFFSGMIREPLAGIESVVPVAASTAVALSSPGRTIEGIIRCAQASDADWGPLTALNLPAMTTHVGAMADALKSIAGHACFSLLKWQIDPVTERIVATWPTRVASPRANALGLHADASFEDIVQAYMRENPNAVLQGAIDKERIAIK